VSLFDHAHHYLPNCATTAAVVEKSSTRRTPPCGPRAGPSGASRMQPACEIAGPEQE